MKWVNIIEHTNKKHMKQIIKKLITSNRFINQLYWYYRLKRDSKVVFSNFGISGNLGSEFKKVKEAHENYGWMPDEYYLYHYDKLTDRDRKSFISEQEHVDVADFLNTTNARRILGDKWETYLEYNLFFCRKAICITNSGGVIGIAYLSYLMSVIN